MTLNEYWDAFLKAQNLPETTPFSGELTFSNENDEFASMVSLILCGKKTCHFSSLDAYKIDMDPIPRAGNYYVLNDFENNPVAVLKTKKVEILPFDQIPWEMAQKEGIDYSLQNFRDRYEAFFMEESDIMGYTYTRDLPVIFEEFEVIYK